MSDLGGWRTIPGFSDYEISRAGRVRRSIHKDHSGKPGHRTKPGSLLKPTKCTNGYWCLTLKTDDGNIKWVYIHHLVAVTFCGPKPTKAHRALHRDDNKDNNRFTNIRWGTSKDNNNDAIKNGSAVFGAFGERSPCSKLKNSQVKEIRRQYDNGKKVSMLARAYNIGYYNMWDVCKRRTYRGIEYV